MEYISPDGVPTGVTTAKSSTSGGSSVVVAALAAFAGLLVFGYGVFPVPVSALGGAHVAAIGLSPVLAGLFATELVPDRPGFSAATARRLSVAFATLAVLLLVAWVLLNYASFAPGEASSA